MVQMRFMPWDGGCGIATDACGMAAMGETTPMISTVRQQAARQQGVRKQAILAAAILATTALAGAASAQPHDAGARATLYEFPNFQGRSITVSGGDDNLQNDNFNDAARSAHFEGDWTVCSDADLRGNCQRLSGDVANLDRYGLSRSVSSLRQGSDYGDAGGAGYGRDPGPDRNGYGDDHDGDYAGAPGDDRGYGSPRGPGSRGDWGADGGVRGRSVVFFARPQMNGQDIAAFDRSAADWFCRRQGLGAAVYYDASFHSRGFRFNGGGFSLNSPVLRDVVCRK